MNIVNHEMKQIAPGKERYENNISPSQMQFVSFGVEQETSYQFFRSIGESESENMHLARLWREGSPERQVVALSAELRRNGLLLKN